MSAYVVVETLLFFAGAAYVAKYLAARDAKESADAPFVPPGDEIVAVSAHDRITPRQRPLVNTGRFSELEGINQQTTLHHVHALQHRSLLPHTRAATGEPGFHRVKDAHRRQQALAMMMKGGNPEYWRVVYANS